METTIKINTDMLSVDFIEGIKKLFPHKTIEIIIQPADETDFILSNKAFATELSDRINAYRSKKEAIILKAEELL